MKKVDFLFIYEVKNRELENITLLAAELERRGYTTAFLNSWYCANNEFKEYDAEVCVISACYNTDVYNFFTRHAADFKKVVNLQWEQVLRNGYVESEGETSWDFSGEALCTRHICWGENTKNRLIKKYNVPEEYLKVCGYICLDFYRDEFKSFFMDKKPLFEEFGLDPGKKTSLFISSFAIATMPKENRGICAGDFNEVFIQNTIDSQKAIVDWYMQACKEYPDMQFIYRAHPSEPVNRTLAELADNVDNFFYVSKYPVKHWINACDKIYNWTSTSAAEVYASGKQSFILMPVLIDHRVSYPFFEGGQTITTYDEFVKSLDKPVCERNQPLDTTRFDDCYMQSESPVYINLCNVLEVTYKSASYHSNKNSTKRPNDYMREAKKYDRFWYSPLNLFVCKISKLLSSDIPFIKVRRDAELPTKEHLKAKQRYTEERIAINYATEEEIRNLISKFRTIIG